MPNDRKKTKFIFYDNGVSPKGEALWAYLGEADEYNGTRKYKINLVMDEAKAQGFMDHITELCEDAMEKLVTSNKKVKPKAKKDCRLKLPFEPEYDEDENETGNIIFKFHCNETNAKGRSLKPKLFDATPRQIMENVYVGNGSIVKVSFQPRGYYVAGADSAGVTLNLKAVQILELVDTMGDGDPGFDSVEDGYQAPDTTGGFTSEDVDDDDF